MRLDLYIQAVVFSGISVAAAETYTITVTNNLEKELLAPVLATATANDRDIFKGNYVTKAAEKQILTGDPALLVKRIGKKGAAVGHGTDGPPKVLLAPGKSISFKVSTKHKSLRISTQELAEQHLDIKGGHLHAYHPKRLGTLMRGLGWVGPKKFKLASGKPKVWGEGKKSLMIHFGLHGSSNS